MDMWLQRLVVRGPLAELTRFRKVAESSSKPIYLTTTPEHCTQKLSFVRLATLLPIDAPDQRIAPEEPLDLLAERLKRHPDSTVELSYGFQFSRFEPDALIRAVSRRYPRSCFVLGMVAPSADEQCSSFIQNGKARCWCLPESRKAKIVSRVPEENEDNCDEVDLALAEADWAMMDEVVDHWKPTVDKFMSGEERRRSATPHVGKRRGDS